MWMKNNMVERKTPLEQQMTSKAEGFQSCPPTMGGVWCLGLGGDGCAWWFGWVGLNLNQNNA